MPRFRTWWPLLAALAGCAEAHTERLPYGEPQVESAFIRSTLRVFENPGFTVGYSEWRRQALWVAFEARAVGRRRLGPRPDGYSQDVRAWFPVRSEDYRGAGYDRGHLAPNYLIGKLYGREAQRATFLMSNISPQSPRLNQLLWQRLEEAEVDVVAPAVGRLQVIAGPVLGEGGPSVAGVAVPEAFYRIWLVGKVGGDWGALAFVMPQVVCGDEPLSAYLVSIDDVERRTGLDFHPDLPDDIEDTLESTIERDGWPWRRMDRTRPRYADHFKDWSCAQA